MFHALLDQIQLNPSLPPFAENHWELRYKIVYEGFEKFIDKLEWPNDPKVGSKLDWKNNMTSPSTWGDEIVLQLASNLLEVDIHHSHYLCLPGLQQQWSDHHKTC